MPNYELELDFYHHICNTCQSTPGEGKCEQVKYMSCAGCKLVSYCCRSHQKSDWRKHRSFCLVVQKLLKNMKCPSLFSILGETSHKDLYNFQSLLVGTIEKQLNRSLSLCERSMIYFPDICGMCLRPNRTAYISCEKCNMQFYCSYDDMQKHSKTHEKDCDFLSLCFKLFKFLSTNTNHPPPRLCQKKVNPPLEFPHSLEEYFCKFIEPEDISNFDKVIFSDIFSYLLTLVYSLKAITNDIKTLDNLSIHILGATQIETYLLCFLDIFFAWISNLQCLNLVFVGPDCPSREEDYIKTLVQKHDDRRLAITFHPGVLYHELFTNCASVGEPDVLVAFNCGFHEFKGQKCDTWKDTIDFILTMKHFVLVTTSYTMQEAEEDSRTFMNNKDRINALKVCEKNPFRSLNPHRDPERSESAVFFFNQFISIFSQNVK